MADLKPIDSNGLEQAYYRIYRNFFDMAEKKRRWNIRDDIPWDKVNPAMSPAIADVVESFCAVELYLPDYIAKALPRFRHKRGKAWFHANWGYEESKHSLALGDWLLKSGLRSEEQMADLERTVFAHEWNLPTESPLGLVMYGMVQELATWLNYRNLRYKVDEIGDPALSTLLRFIYVDERAHHDFYRRISLLYMERDRAGSIEELRRVIASFNMPALYLLADSRQRTAAIKELNIFDTDIFYRDVVRPILDELGVSWSEFRQRNPAHKSTPAPAAQT
jgi:acyl-[acyl-carrier-protein] desaturase